MRHMFFIGKDFLQPGRLQEDLVIQAKDAEKNSYSMILKVMSQFY